MDNVIQGLKAEREQLIQALKTVQAADHAHILEKKLELDTAIQWLEQITSLQLHPPKDYIFAKLPETKNAFSEYKIVETLESDDPGDWQELKLTHEGEELWLYTGDWVLKSKI